MTTTKLLEKLNRANPSPTVPLSEHEDSELRARIDQKRSHIPFEGQSARRGVRIDQRRWLPDRRQLTTAAVTFVAVVAMVAVVALQRPNGVDPAVPTAQRTPVTQPNSLGVAGGSETADEGQDDPLPSSDGSVVGSLQPGVPRSAETGGTPLPDVENAVPGDDGAGPLPLGTVLELPGDDYLDFLFEFCTPDCYRDAHFMNPENPGAGSGPWPTGRPFHIRHGFPAQSGEPLGPGYDVVVYVTPMDLPGEFDGASTGESVRYSSDYVVRGESDACGPNYKAQDGSVTCEWFVHDFADGLPAGRFALWTFWEAPCSAWVEFGLKSECEDPTEVMSLFRSGVDSPFDAFSPSFTEQNHADLSTDEIDNLFGHPPNGGLELGPPIDASGAVANFSTTTPNFAGAVAGDEGSNPLPLGTVNELPGEDYLDFLFEFCPSSCYRDAHFMDPHNPDVGSGPWTADRAFHVRHGFPARGYEPLGPGFDVVMYVTSMDWTPGEDGGAPVGQTVRYTSDFVLRGESDQCGPTYKRQTEPVTCEWFVHDFPDGLPAGRYDLWVVWEAPCQAWVEYGFTDSCADPSQVLSLFSSGVNSPFDNGPPSFTEWNEG